jgi:hypothetical protein
MPGWDTIRGRDLVDEDTSNRWAQQDGRMGEAEAAVVDLRGGRAGPLRLAIGRGLADRTPQGRRSLRSARAEHDRVCQRLKDRQRQRKQCRHQHKGAHLGRGLPSRHWHNYDDAADLHNGDFHSLGAAVGTAAILRISRGMVRFVLAVLPAVASLRLAAR